MLKDLTPFNIKKMDKQKTDIKGLSYNEYHKKYYQDKIKGEKRICVCGLEVDKFRFARHNRSIKHNKRMDKIKLENPEQIISENNIKK